MAATGKTPILLYGSTTPTNAPTAGNLNNSSDGCEIAINVADKNLFFKDATNTINTVPIRQSSASSNGWLSSTDWSTFNGKQPAGTYVTSVSGTAPVVSSGGTTPAISMAAATSSVNGYLTSTDWSTFNNKQPAGSYAVTNAGQTFSGVQIFSTRVVSGNTAAVGTSNLQAHGANGAVCANSIFSVQKQGEGYGLFFSVAGSGSSYIQSGVFNDGGYYDLYLQNNGGNTYIGQGDLTVKTGNLVIGTSGKGIDFSATAGTGTSELLADYEEGDWTPELTRDTPPTLSYTYQVGKYVKVGRQVTVNGSLIFTVTGSGGGLVYISGLPYAGNATSAYSASGSVAYCDCLSGGADGFYIGQSGTTGVVTLNGNFANSTLGNGRIYFSLTYQV